MWLASKDINRRKRGGGAYAHATQARSPPSIFFLPQERERLKRNFKSTGLDPYRLFVMVEALTILGLSSRWSIQKDPRRLHPFPAEGKEIWNQCLDLQIRTHRYKLNPCL